MRIDYAKELHRIREESVAEHTDFQRQLSEQRNQLTDQLERVRTESFFGQIDISLGEVGSVLERSRAVTGSPGRVGTFVERALRLHHAELVDRGGGFYSVVGRPPELEAVLGNEDELLTFDPVMGAGETDVDVVDLAHPLLRTLVELVRDRALTPAGPGRVTGWATGAVDEVTGIVHLLARYVALADPPVVLEELVRIALPVWSDGEPVANVDSLVEAPPASGAYNAADVAEAAAELLKGPDLRQHINDHLEALRSDLGQRHASLRGEWASGLEQIELASFDPVAITVLFPGEPA